VQRPFARNLVHFARYLRERGLPLVPRRTALLLQAVEAVGLSERDDAYYAMRAAAVIRPEDLPVFDEAFDLFFGGGMPPARPDSEQADLSEEEVRLLVAGSTEAETEAVDLSEQTGASATERLAHRDFGEMTPKEIQEVRTLVARMMWQPQDIKSRRWMRGGPGARPHLRRTLRNLVGPRGELVPLEWSERKLRRRPLLVIADVSGSMERYAEMFLYFMHAVRGRLGKLEGFVFSTRLTRITRELSQRDAQMALDGVSRAVDDWSGGTKIGEAFEEFNRRWSRRVTRGGPIALVVSDGWDCGDPELLAREMGHFRRTVHRVLWLNPLAGRPGYEPLARGVQAILPHVDDFLPASNLVHLREVVELIESVPSRR
jgi:uncharacterized protein with von Willebrand factor type A (vWA) domain